MVSRALVLAGLFLVVAVAVCNAYRGREGDRGGERGGGREGKWGGGREGKWGGGRRGGRGNRHNTFPLAAGGCSVDYACKECAAENVAVYNSTVKRSDCTWTWDWRQFDWKRTCTERSENVTVVRKYCCPMCLGKPVPTYKNYTVHTYKNNTENNETNTVLVKYSCTPQCWMGEQCNGCPETAVNNNFGRKSCCANCTQSATSTFIWGWRAACVCNVNLPVNATIPTPHRRKWDNSDEDTKRKQKN